MLEHFCTTTLCQRHPTLASQTHEGLHHLWALPWHMAIFFLFFSFFFLNAKASSFLIHSHVTYRTPCHARGHPHSYLGKRRICLGVRGILSMYLRTHTLFTSHQKRVILSRLDLYASASPWSKGSTVIEPASRWFWTCILKSPIC